MTTATKSAATGSSTAFTAEERAAMQARAGEVRAGRGRGKDKAAAEVQAVHDAIAALPTTDRALAEKLHVLVTEAAPELAHKTWYGMPAYFKEGKVLCYFKAASKFKTGMPSSASRTPRSSTTEPFGRPCTRSPTSPRPA